MLNTALTGLVTCLGFEVVRRMYDSGFLGRMILLIIVLKITRAMVIFEIWTF